MVVPLIEPTSDTRHLVSAALFGLKRIYRPGFWYKKAGVMLMELSTEGTKQFSLFETQGINPVRSEKLMGILDHLNQSYGRDIIVLG